MKRYIITLFQVLLLIVLAAILLVTYQALVRPTDVYVFNQDIDSGIKITNSMVKVVKAPKSALNTADYVTKREDLTGKVTTGRVFAGQYVLKPNLIDSDKVSPFSDTEAMEQLRKVAIVASFDSLAGGTLQKGDKVDLLLSKKTKSERGFDEYETKTFLTDVLIYNVIDDDGNTYLYNETKYNDKKDADAETGKSSDDENAYGENVATVIVAVKPSDAELIVNNQLEGKISIVTQFPKIDVK